MSKPNYKRRLLLFITGVFMVGFLTGATIALVCSAAKSEPTKNFPKEFQETIITPEEVHAMALTLAGECYENQPQDKRDVAWVICNRATDGRFGEGIIGVVSSTEHAVQFAGYWVQGRSISESDIDIAEEVLAAYYAGEEPIHDYLYFTGGTGVTNNFRK